MSNGIATIALTLTACLAWALCSAAVLGDAGAGVTVSGERIGAGPFKPNWESLKQYEVPQWFQDAKFGIWAHWSPQCVPEEGDWYARGMYQEGSDQYNYQVKTYGHPSAFGYKDICNLWTAARWDPDRLMQLYKRAGAQYFVALANHHCNFDCWDSTYQEWNSVRVGPKKDIVGIWERTARKYGLRFGVTVHSARTWDWFQVAHESDKTGPMAGVPYDGALTKADGKGTWWEGLDPQELYCKAHADGVPPDAAYVEKWFLRTRELIDKYQPDLLYFDDWLLPLGQTGLDIGAHFYNASVRRAGKVDVVLNTKGVPPELRHTCVLDIERGLAGGMEEFPWQTDTCIGEWHYHRNINYKSADDVVHMLVDIVSKNGNLLLNIPVRGDGTIDEKEEAFLQDLAGWMDVNRSSILGTRTWLTYGEGPVAAGGGSLDEGPRPFSSRDFRFLQKGKTLYLFALGWPEDGEWRIRSLAKLPEANARISKVTLLGSKTRVEWRHSGKGLIVRAPAVKPCQYVWVLKVEGANLRGFRPDLVPPEPKPSVGPDQQGNLRLGMDVVETHGPGLRTEQRGGVLNLGFWDSSEAWASWRVKLEKGAAYAVTAECAGAAGPSAIRLECAGQTLLGQVPQAKSWDDFGVVALGDLRVGDGGEVDLSVKPADPSTWRAINLRGLTLTRR
jgi:alpha-L-fucosidase